MHTIFYAHILDISVDLKKKRKKTTIRNMQEVTFPCVVIYFFVYLAMKYEDIEDHSLAH